MKLIVPSSLNDITLIQYQEYNQEIEARKELPDAEEYLLIKKIEIFCKLTREQVLLIEYSSIKEISDILDNILKEQPNLTEKFTVNGVKFGWLPKLDDMSYGELLDLNSNISDWDSMQVAMGVLYRPIKQELKNGLYNIEKYEGDKYHKDLRQMPLSAVIGAMVFFWNLGLDCLKYITKSLEVNLTDFQNQLTLTETGIGIQQSMNSLEVILQNMKLLNK
jgi:hypothetical protein